MAHILLLKVNPWCIKVNFFCTHSKQRRLVSTLESNCVDEFGALLQG